jgi:hypothetical protein
MVLAQTMNWVVLAGMYGVMVGTSNGIMSTAGSSIWDDYFGRRHLGSISGLRSSISRISSALGALPLALAFNLTGSYNLALMIEMAVRCCRRYSISLRSRPSVLPPASDSSWRSLGSSRIVPSAEGARTIPTTARPAPPLESA